MTETPHPNSHGDHSKSGPQAETRTPPVGVELAMGLEPMTCRLQGGCSGQLSYASKWVRIASHASERPRSMREMRQRMR